MTINGVEITALSLVLVGRLMAVQVEMLSIG